MPYAFFSSLRLHTYSIRMVARVPAVILALLLLAAASAMTVTAWTDSAIIDEIPHIAAGYGYAHERDARLNPEHPPLVKLLSALPLLAVQPTFPTDAPAWTRDVNGQWDMGVAFLYQSGNDADLLVFLARIAPILLTLLLIFLTYAWARERIGRWWALLPAALLSFSPIVLAHGHYVTTDIGAALGVLLALYTFTSYLVSPSRRRLLLAGIGLGVALLLKFSTVLLIPFLGLLAFVFFLIHRPYRFLALMRLAGGLIAVFFIAGLCIYAIYAITTSGYPVARQVADTTALLDNFPVRAVADATIFMAGSPVLRPLAEYILGVLMVLQRSAGGNTVFFLGEVATIGWWYYFPVMLFFKETMAALVLAAIAAVVGLRTAWAFFVRPRLHRVRAMAHGITEHLQIYFPEFAMAAFVALYWVSSISSPLNIGVRHILPTLPLLYILIASGIRRWALLPFSFARGGILSALRMLSGAALRVAVIVGLMGWLVVESFIASPHYLSHMNLFAGGTDEGYRIAVDSNYDWGQDMKRLSAQIADTVPADERIAIDFFGWEPSYYLGDRAVHWRSADGDPRAEGIRWFAISATFLQNSLGTPVRGFTRGEVDNYTWLTEAVDPYAPVARGGTSAFLYRLE